MPEYLSPGVFIEEIDAGPRPIAGVSTSTAGMVGVTRRGPEDGKPRLVTSYLEFQRTFGGLLPEPSATTAARLGDAEEGGKWWAFPLAVRGFFENGGQRLYVKRVVSAEGTRATVKTGRGLRSEITQDAAPDAATIEVRHLLGFTGIGQTVAIRRGDTDAELVAEATVQSYEQGARTRVTLAAAVGTGLSAARGDYIVPASPVAAADTVTFAASSRGGWGQRVQVLVRPVAGEQLPLLPDSAAGDFFVTRLTKDVTAAAHDVFVPKADVAGVGAQEDFWVLIRGDVFQARKDAESGDDVKLTITDLPADPRWKADDPVRRVRFANEPGATALRVGGAGRLYPDALLQFDDGEKLLIRRVTQIDGDVVTVDAPLAARYFDNQRVYLVEAEAAARFTDEDGDVTDETFANLHWNATEAVGLVRTVAGRSELVTASVTAGTTLAGGSDDAGFWFAGGDAGWTSLGADGLDGFDELKVSDFVGGEDPETGLTTGIAALESIDEIAICAVPGIWSGTVQQSLIGQCEDLKDRFAVLDPRDGLTVDGIRDFRAPYDTKYAAMYYPWVVVNHPITGLPYTVPPAGHIAGVYARTDVERGVHKAPANAIVRGINLRDGLATDLTRRHQDMLNPKGINALRFFPGMGNRVWGARTLSSDSAWRYVNVRRLFIFLEESIEEGTQWVVFEPNAEPLWALVKQTVENFLDTVWRSGALAGTTPDEAYFVACDRTTMTESDQQNGRLVCVIGVAPVFPAEFVIFRIQQKTRETQPA
ncbi:tail protein [Actinoplanes sp. OR16]|uniref:phage tail sheath family protein n=1 Tax=Actinoplanes sp. OR16 TaxID=946334 RepID=UPI000F72035D|nr:phage tail sheath C-terminal domain-containing protein [Actinoplanes sp. OR16]BBH69386.1 tail protein [Actinoplanes sp. OR16]